jgi:glycosyltransferase involved in cell wall biosynthesis
MASNPLVSILINNYNYAPYLRHAIDSALGQTYTNIEVIVVDDGSQDDSRQIIESYGDKIIPIFKENGGQASAFNAGFLRATGDIVCFLDSDDLFHPQKLESVVEAFSKHPEIGWHYHPLKFVDQQGKTLAEETYPTSSRIYDVRAQLKRGKLRGCLPLDSIATSCMSFRHTLLKRILPMPEEIRITSDDYIKYAALGLTPGFILLEEVASQRLHGSNHYTQSPKENPNSQKRKIVAEVLLLTAYWLRFNFPHLSSFCNKVFAIGCAIRIQTGASDKRCTSLIDDYLSASAPLERLNIRFRIWFNLLFR